MSEQKTVDQIVLDTDNAAAQPHTMTGWLSRNGRFYDNERIARYDGSTHRKCACGDVCSKDLSRCTKCQAKLDHEKWLALPLVEWNGQTPLCNGDDYFFDAESVYEYCKENDLQVGDLELVVCVPNNAREIDIDYFCDELPEDGELPSELEAAIEIFNAAIRAAGPISWSPGEQRVVMPEIENE